jgi:hypothetical protein
MKTFIQRGVVLVVLLLLCELACAQQRHVLDSVDVYTGISFPDWFTVGARHRFGQNNVGITFGSFPDYEGRFKSLMIVLGYYRHLFGHSKHTHQMPWFVHAGAGYYHIPHQPLRYYYYEPHIQEHIVRARVYAGRDLNLSDRVGFSISYGINVIVYAEYDDMKDIHVPAAPVSGGLDVIFFYRFKGKTL